MDRGMVRVIIIIIIFLAHQHKAAGRKTRLDINTYYYYYKRILLPWSRKTSRALSNRKDKTNNSVMQDKNRSQTVRDQMRACVKHIGKPCKTAKPINMLFRMQTPMGVLLLDGVHTSAIWQINQGYSDDTVCHRHHGSNLLNLELDTEVQQSKST